MSHTPEPWIAESDSRPGNEEWHVKAGNTYFAVDGGYEVWGMTESDARLIAAAPELLAALKNEHGAPEDNGCLPSVCQSCKAIAHAEGRT